MIDPHRDEVARDRRRWDAAVDLELERQIGLNWCWAAVAKGIVDHYGGPSQQQCEYATTFLRQSTTCCGGDELEPRCDAAFDLDTVLAHHGVYASPPRRRPPPLELLRGELERDRPVVALVRFPSSVHAVAITAVDVARRRIGVCDPWLEPKRTAIDAAEFECAYDGSGRWCYTILTRPRDEAHARDAVSLLRDRALQRDRGYSSMPRHGSATLELDVFEADAEQLALGTGLHTTERASRVTVRLDAFAHDAPRRLDRIFTALRKDVEARTERGFDVRLVRCFAIKFEALWFIDLSTTSRRTDHYVPIPPVPYYLEAGQEYAAAELGEILAEPARACLPSIETNRAFLERLDFETAFLPGG